MHLHVDLGLDFVECIAATAAHRSQSSVAFLSDKALVKLSVGLVSGSLHWDSGLLRQEAHMLNPCATMVAAAEAGTQTP